MNIRGVDSVILGVEEMDAAQRFLRNFGLTEFERGQHGARFETLDGTDLVLRGSADCSLPMAVGAQANAREIVWGVESSEELQKVGSELSRDRQVAVAADGVLRTTDASGYGIAFQVTRRHAYDARPGLINVAGLPPQRSPNQRVDFKAPHRPRSIGHIVLYVPDLERARDFYVERLGFRLTDSYRDRSCFLRAPEAVVVMIALFESKEAFRRFESCSISASIGSTGTAKIIGRSIGRKDRQRRGRQAQIYAGQGGMEGHTANKALKW
jgi:hypothetical protein